MIGKREFNVFMFDEKYSIHPFFIFFYSFPGQSQFVATCLSPKTYCHVIDVLCFPGSRSRPVADAEMFQQRASGCHTF